MRNLIHGLVMEAAQTCGPMPFVIHFKPLPVFFEILDEQFPSMPIIDIGAGCGDLSRQLAEHGRKVCAIDPFERESTVFQIAPLDACTFRYPPSSLPIMARPCHGLWIELAIKQALNCVACKTLLYVGLEKNFEDDLYGLEGLSLAYGNVAVGEEEERIVTIKL
jgi:hypothetical protein